MNKKRAIWLAAIIMMISVGTLLIVPTMTKNQGSELAMAMGEDIYTYRMLTSDAQGKQRWLTFTADHRLKQRHYLKIETKGQNVNSWEAVATNQVPQNIQEVLA